MRDHQLIADAEATLLASIAAELKPEYINEEAIQLWQGSPFQWLKPPISSRQIGAAAEKLVAHWCVDKGFAVARSPDREADLVINGARVEVKYSSLWTDNHHYRFQQIRDQDYDYCFCLGISPFDAHAWFIPKTELMVDKPPELRPQHGGQDGRDTKWLGFPADNPPVWLSAYGGTLADVYRLILKARESRFD